MTSDDSVNGFSGNPVIIFQTSKKSKKILVLEIIHPLASYTKYYATREKSPSLLHDLKKSSSWGVSSILADFSSRVGINA